MNNQKTFYLLSPDFMDFHLTKDVGIIPMIMQKYHGYKAVYSVYKPSNASLELPSLKFFSDDVEFDFIEPSFPYDPENKMNTIFGANIKDCCLDMVNYIEKMAKKINVLFLFGFYPYYFDAVARYKELNPEGKVYLKLDANIGWINNTLLSDQFIKFLKNCDLITSETLIEYLNKKWPVPVHYIPNGYYSFDRNNDHLKEVISFDKKQDYILTFGRLGTPQKATDLLLESFKLALPHIPESWKLVLGGKIEDSFVPYIQNFLDENPELLERILFLGFIDDKGILNEWFSKAKIFALPSKFEGFANVYSEAKAHGCYLVVSDIEAGRDAVSRNDLRGNEFSEEYKAETRQCDFGSLHAVDNSAELANRFIEACNNQETLKEVCYKTQQDTLEHFDWVKLCKRIDILLR